MYSRIACSTTGETWLGICGRRLAWGSSPTGATEAVVRLLRGEDIDTVSRELGVTAATLATWRDEFLAGGQSALKSRPAHHRDAEMMRLRAKVGELMMDNEVLEYGIRRYEEELGRPPFVAAEVEGLAQTLGIERLSKSQVSVMAKSLDGMVDDFRNRPLDAGPYSYVWIDALTQRCREGGRVVNVCTAIATGVNAGGYREILGVDVFTAEDGAAWTSFLRGLVARGLSGVRLVISDDHLGLKQAIAAVLSGTGWQRCRVHLVRNLLTRVPKSAGTLVATLVRSIFAQPDHAAVWAQHTRMGEQLHERFPKAAALLADAGPDVLAFATFPREHWRQIWSNHPQERLNKEVRRRTDVVGIFPDRCTIVRLVGAVLDEQHDEWTVASRRYLSAESLKAAQAFSVEEKEVVPALAAAS